VDSRATAQRWLRKFSCTPHRPGWRTSRGPLEHAPRLCQCGRAVVGSTADHGRRRVRGHLHGMHTAPDRQIPGGAPDDEIHAVLAAVRGRPEGPTPADVGRCGQAAGGPARSLRFDGALRAGRPGIARGTLRARCSLLPLRTGLALRTGLVPGDRGVPPGARRCLRRVDLDVVEHPELAEAALVDGLVEPAAPAATASADPAPASTTAPAPATVVRRTNLRTGLACHLGMDGPSS
jgi:hypothetical protein